MKDNTNNQAAGYNKPLLYVWRNLVCSDYGPKSLTRLVLLVLSLHMNSTGGSCFPSADTVAKRAGISKRAACEHLKTAAEKGWIIRSPRAKSGQGWRRWSYQAAIPAGLRSDRESPTCPNVEQSASEIGNRRRSHVGTQGHSNYPKNNLNSSEWIEFGRLLRIVQHEREQETSYIERVRKANERRIANL